MNCVPILLSTVLPYMGLIDLSYLQVLSKISSRMLSQTIQSVKQTKNSYGGPALHSIREVLKIGKLVAALHRPFVTGNRIVEI